MVGVGHGDEEGPAFFSPVSPVLRGHLQADLHRGRAIIGIEAVVELARRDGRQPGGQLSGSRVGRSGEDHLLELFHLAAESAVEPGVGVSE